MVDFGLEVEGRRLERVVGGKRKGKYEGSALRLQNRDWDNWMDFEGGQRATNGVRRVFGARQLDLPFIKVGI